MTTTLSGTRTCKKTAAFEWLRKRTAVLMAGLIGFWQVAPSVQAATLTWDTVAGDGGTITGGSGTWTNGLGGWNTGSGDTTWNSATPDSAIFTGGGVIGFGGPVTVGNILFNSGTILAGGGTLTLSNSTITTNAAVRIGGVLDGSTGLIKDGSATLTIDGTNTYTGPTIVNAGTLNVIQLADGGTNSNIGAASNAAANLVLNGGTLKYSPGAAADASTDRLFSVGTSGGTIDASSAFGINFTNAGSMGFNGQSGARTLTLAGTNVSGNSLAAVIGDNGGATSLTKVDAGKWGLGGSNSYTGVTSVSGGILSVSNLADGGQSSSIGAATNSAANLIIQSTLQYNGAAASTDRLFTVGSLQPTLEASGTGALSFTNAGSLAFVSSGTHTLTLTGTNTDSNTFAPVIGDNGGATGLTKSGSGTWLLTGTNNYTGTTIINDGVLQIGNGGTVGTLGSGAVTDKASLVVNRSDALTITNAISGVGSFTQAGAGTTTITGSMSYSGTTSVSAGTLQAGAPFVFAVNSVVTVDSGAVLALNGFNNAIGPLSGTGTVQNGTVTAATLSVGGSVNTSFDGVIQNGGSASLALNKTGAATLTLTGANTYTGGTLVSNGVLSVSSLANGGAPSSIGASSSVASVLVLNGGTLSYTGAATSTDRLFSVTTTGGGLDASGTGAVNFTNTGSMGFNTQSGARTLTLTGTNTGNNTIAAVMGDNGGATALTKSGVGTWVISAANSYTGATTITGGQLVVTNLANGGSASNIGAATSGAANLVLNGGALKYTGAGSSTDRLFSVGLASGTLDASGSGTVNFTNTGSIGSNGQTSARTLILTGTNTGNNTLAATVPNFSGTTNVDKNGTGTWVLTGTSTYTGATTISGGVLSVTNLANGGSASSLGSTSSGAGGLLLDGGTLRYSGVSASTDRLISVGTGGGGLDASGTGPVNFTNTGSLGFNNQTGARTLSLTGANAGSNILAASIADNSGATALTKGGTGNWTLTGSNSYSGVTTISGGVLNVTTLANGGSNSNIGASSSAAGNLVLNGGTLKYSPGAASPVSTDRLFSVGTSGGTIDASGGFNINFTNTGSIGFNGQSGTRTLTLTGNNANDNTLAAVIGDNGGATSVTKAGGGIWVLSGASTYTGVTTVSGTAVLKVSSLANGGVASSIGASTNAASNLVLNGGTFTYTGAAVSTDRLFSLGTSGITLNVFGTGGVTFTNTGSMGFNGQTGTRTLTLANSLGGTSTIAAVIGDNAGATAVTHTLASSTWALTGANTYTGVTTLSGGVLSVTSLANGGSASGIGAATNANTNLVLSGGTLQYTGAGSSTDRLFSVGTSGGTLDSSGTGAVNFTNTGSVGFNSQTGTRTLTLTGTNTGANTIAAVVGDNSGATALTKSGAGTWVLTGTNIYTGTTTVIAGSLQVGGGGTNGTLGSGTVTDNANLTFNRSDAIAVSNVISGTGSVTHTGTGTTTLSGASSYTGATTINAGVLSVTSLANGGSSSNIGASANVAANLVLNGGTLRYTGGFGSTDRLFSVGTSGGTLDSSGGVFSYTNTGSMGFNGQSSTRTLNLTGTSGGGNVLAALIGDNGGATSLIKSGAGTWMLTANNTYTGTTTISGGTLALGNMTATGSISGDIVNNGTLMLNNTSGLTLTQIISGTGGVSVNAGANNTLSGNNTYTGVTSIPSGLTLSIATIADGGVASNLGAASNAATNIVLTNGILKYTGTGSSTDRLFGIGTLGGTLNASGTGAVNFTNAGSMGFNSLSGARTLTLTGTNTGGNTLAAAIGDNGGATALSKTGAGTWVITGANTYTGTTTISAGVLQVGSGGTAGTLGSGAVTDNGNLTFNRSDALTVANTISGSGTLTQAGTGTTTLSGTNSYGGATTVNGGVLNVTTLANGGSNSNIGASDNSAANLVLNGGTLKYSPGAVAAVSTDRLFSVGTSGGTIDASGGFNINFTNTGSIGFNGQSGARTLTLTGNNTNDNTLAAVIGDNGGATSVTKAGGGIWVLSGASTYTGVTTVSGTAVLKVSSLANGGSASNIGASTSAASNLVLNGGTFTYTGAATSTDRLFSLGTSGITLNAFGTGGVNFTNTGSMGFSGSGARTLTLANSIGGTSTIAAVIGDNGGATSVTRINTGTWALTGANTYTGVTTLTGGTLTTTSLANGGSASNIGSATNVATNLVLNGGTLQYTGTGANTDRLFSLGTSGGTLDASGTVADLRFTNTGSMGFNGQSGARTLTLTGTYLGFNSVAAVIGDNGGATSVTKTGTGKWVLTGNNTYSGTTTVSGGVLQIGYLTASGSVGTGNLVNNGILVLYRSDTSTLANVISGTGSLSHAQGTVTLSGLNSYTGSTSVLVGTLIVDTLANGGSNSNIGASASIVNNLQLNGGTLKYTGAAVSTDRLFTLGGTGGIDASGTGAVNFTNTGVMGRTFTTARTLTLSGTNTGSNTLAAVISDNTGATAVTKSGVGTWVLSGANTYTGITTISGGVLSVSSLANGGSASGIGAAANTATNLVLNGGTLQYTGGAGTTDRLFSVGTNGGTLDSSGSAGLTFANAGSMGFNSQNGARVLTLTGTSSFGTNQIAAVIGDNGGATSLVKNGTGVWALTGTNTYTGTTTINSGSLNVGANGSSGTLGSGNVINNAQLLLMRTGSLTMAQNISGSGKLIQGASGTVTLSGNNTYTGVTILAGAGVVSISSLGNGGSASGIGAATNDASNIVFSSVAATLRYTGAGTSTDRLFSIDVGAGAVLDASGTGAINFNNPGAMGLTPGGASPRTLTLTGSNTGNNTLAAVVGESGVTTSVTKSGVGTWLLTGASTYTGTTTVSNGKLVVTSLADGGSASNIGAASNTASNLVINAATLQYTGAGSSTDRLFSIGTGNGTLDASGSGAVNFTNTGAMGFNGQSGTRSLSLAGTGTGSIAAAIGDNGGATTVLGTGTGTWTLSGASTYTGSTRVSSGVLIASTLADGGVASSIGASSNVAANLWLSGGTLRYLGAAVSTDRLFTLGVGNSALDASGTGAVNFTNTGSMDFNGTGARVLTLTGSNTGNNTLATVIGDNGGATTLTKLGAGTWVMTGTNTYTGPTNINAGTLQVGNGGTSGTLGTGTVTIATALIVNRSDAVTIANTTGGVGTFTQAGSGTTTFITGTKSYTGATFVNAGKLQAGGANAFSTGSAVTVAGGGVLEVNGFNNLIGGLSGTGTVQNGTATQATLNIGGSANSSFDGLIQNGGSAFLSINKGGAGGTLTLTGSNTYTGSTVLSAGVLSVSTLANGGVASNIGASSNAASNIILTGGTLSYTGAAVSTDHLFSVTTVGGSLDASGTGAVNFTNTGSMAFNSQTGARTLTLTGTNTGANTIAAVIGDNSGATALTKTGAGTWVLTGANSYTGTTTINAGVLQVGSGGTTGALGSGSVSNNASLVINRSDAITVVNAISGSGSLTQAGGGTTTLTGTNSYSGGTTINAGTLQVGNGGTTGTVGTGAISNSGTLTINRSDAITISGSMSGTGAFIQNGTGTTTLSGANQWGSATVNAGTLAAGATNGIGSLSPMTVNATGTLVISGLGTSAAVGSLAGSGVVKNGGVTASTIAVGSLLSTTTTFSGTIIDGGTGTMTLEKGGTSYTLILTGASSYTGPTRIFAGTLSVSSLADGGSASSIGASTSAATNLVFKTSSAVFKYTGAAVNTDRLFSVSGGGTLDASGSGALNLTNTGAMGFDGFSGVRTLALAGTNSGNNTLAAVIGDNGGATSLTKSGVGTWLITGANTYTGTTLISAGILQVGSGGTSGSLGSGGVTNNASLVFNRSDTVSVANVLSGSGSVAQAGAGTTTLTGTNTYTGKTIINAGVLKVAAIGNGGSNSNLGAASNNAANLVLNGGTLQYTGGAASTDRLFSVGTSGGTLDASGTGAVNFTNTGNMGFNAQNGARTLTLSGTNTDSNTLAAVMGDNGGATSLTKSGVGTWVLTGTNTYTGTTTISAGVLQVGIGGTSGSLGSGAVTDNASLVFNRSDAITVANTISGSGSLTQVGTGTTTLTGANSYTGSTILNAGALSVAAIANGGTSSNLGSASSAATNLVLNGAALQYTGAATTTDRLFSVGTNGGTVEASGTGAVNFSNTGSMGFNGQSGARTLTLGGTNTGGNTLAAALGDNGGATALVKSGAGTWVLTGANTYTGTTTISAGELQIGSGGTNGTLGSGAVTNSAQLTLNRSDAITVANAISGSGSFTQVGTGTTTLSGTNLYTAVTTITSGVLNVTTLADGGSGSSIGAASNAATNLVINGGTLQYTGSSNVSTDRLFSVGIGSAVIDVSGTGNVNFTNTGSMGFNGQSGPRTLLLTGTNTTGVNIIASAIGDFGGSTAVTIDGAATWLLTGANTYTGATTVSAGVLQIGGSHLTSAIIIGASATLEINGLNTSIGSLAGSGIVQNNSATAATLSLGGNNINTSFSGVIRDGGAGALSLVKTGSGIFTLTGANSYSGTTTISAGELQIGSGGTTGTIGTGAVTNNAQLTINRSNAITLANDISGSGSLTQAGAGTTTLAGANSYAGSTTINAGVLSVAVLANGGFSSNVGASSNAATSLVLNGGTLQYTGADVSSDRLFSVGTNGGTVETSGTGAVNFTNTGSMGFNGQSGIRTLTLAGTNTGNNTLAAEIGDNGGATALTKSGAGTWILTGSNDYSGGTTVNAGVLQVGSGGTTGSLGTGAVTDNAQLTINRADAITLANTITGSGSLTQAGAGSTTLTGTNRYGGSTTINAGVLSVAVLADGGSSSNLGASTNAATHLVLNGGALQYTGDAVSTDRLFSVGSNGGTVEASGAGAVNFTNTGSMGFNGESGARLLTLGGSDTGSNMLAAVIGDNGGATALAKTGAGTWVLTGMNTYTGTTTLSGGELQIGSGGATGMLGTGNVVNNASLTVNRSNAVTLANTMSGSGSFTQAGSGVTTLTGSSSYTGGTTINAGVLSVALLANGGASSNVGASTNAATNLVINGGTLQYTGGATSTDRLFSVGTGGGVLDASGTGAVNFTNTGSMGFNGQSGVRALTLTGTNTGSNTLAAVIGDSGGATTLSKNGGGIWVLNAANTYTGGTTVNAGTLQIGNGGTTGSLSTASVLINDGTLAFNRSDAVTQGTHFASLISGSGGVTQAGSGTLTLNSANTYAGETNVRAGTLEATINNALGTNAAGTTVSSGATLLLSNVNYSTAEALALNGSGAGNGGALRNSGTSTYTGAITAATNASINTGGGILNLTGGLVKDGTVLTLTGGGTVNVSGTGISGASANSDLVVDGTTLVVSADSDYNGPTTVKNSAGLIANAAVMTTRLDLSSDSTLAGTGAITTAVNQSMLINGTFIVGDPAVVPAATTFALTTSGTGAVVLGAGSVIRLDLFNGAGLGNNLSNATAADSINLHGKIDATAGGTLVIGNPNGMTNFHGGDQWQLFKLNTGGANAGSFVSDLALNDSSLQLASGITSFLDQGTGVLSVIDTNGGLALAAVEGQALISGGNTVTADLNGHLFNLRAGGGEEEEEKTDGSIAAALDEGVIVGEGDGDPKKASPIAKRVPRSRQWEVFATVTYGNIKLNPISTQAGVQVDAWASGVGIERHLSRSLTVGFAASFLQSSQGYTGNAGSLRLEGPALSAYASYVRGSFWNSLLYSFGTYQVDSIRNPGVPFPTALGSTQAYTHAVQYNTGWNFRFQNNTLVTGPFLGVDYLHGSVDAYSETGGGLAALHYSAQSFQSLVSRVGWSASKQVKTRFARITPQVRLSYERQNLKSNNGTSVSLINVPFSATGGNQSPGQDYLVAGLGLSLAFTDQFSLMLSYQGQFFRHDLQAHFGSIRFSYRF